MKSTILKLRDNLQGSFEENKDKDEKIKKLQEKVDGQDKVFNEEVDQQKITLLTTIDDHLSSAGVKNQPRDKAGDSDTVDSLFTSVLDKIKNVPKASSIKREPSTNQEVEELENLNKDLEYQIKDIKEKLEKKEKELSLMTKQKDTLRAQLGSAVESLNAKDNDASPRRVAETDMLPSLQSQLYQLQDESKMSEVTRDVTDQLIDSFERNDRKMREKLDKALRKIKELKRVQSGPIDDSTIKAELKAELKKEIRAEEIEKRNREIERQRKLMAVKSEEQSLEFNQKIEELEAKLEAKDDELADLRIKLSDAETEIDKLRNTGDKKSFTSNEEQVNESSTSSFTKNAKKSQLQEDDKIQSIENPNTPKIYKSSEEINHKLQQMKADKIKVQIVKKADIEGINWYLLEQKETLDKPLSLKTSPSDPKSVSEVSSSRKLFWV